MDVIQECAENFLRLCNTTTYTLHISNKGKISVLNIDFREADFHHIAGFQYLTDINIPKSKKGIIPWILDVNNPVGDDYLGKSVYYKGREYDEKDVELRISELRFLEEYLDADNIVYLYSPGNAPRNNSLIRCDYIIESKIKERGETVYIFLVKRKGADNYYRIISFCVKKSAPYGGIYYYIMYKYKLVNNEKIILFRHNKYTDEQILINDAIG